MAFVKKQDLVVFNLEKGRIKALVTDIQWRKFRKAYKDKQTGEKKIKLKSVPYAICTITGSNIEPYNIGTQFIIAGYKLKSHTMFGEKCLMLSNQYIAEFEHDGESWVIDMLNESRKNKKKSFSNR